MIHPATGFPLGDPSVLPLSVHPTPAEAREFFDSLILSASGWRGVFGSSDDDMAESIVPAKAWAAASMASVFADFLLGVVPRGPVLALGIDTRPTGPAIADVMARVFLAKGIVVRYAFVCAAPEIMAWTKRSGALPPDNPDHLDAFCYISASHNPPGHNGVKFGLSDGGVLPGSDARTLISRLKDASSGSANIARMAALVAAADTKAVSALYAACGAAKRKAISDYTLFAREVAAAASDLPTQERTLDALAAAVAARGAGIVVDMNGSARTLSIDADFMSALCVETRLINAQPRRFAHRIVPEGESLEPCRLELERVHLHEPNFVLGYVPDCDGDRGNIVFWDDDAGAARALEAQDTFALAVLAELATMASSALRDGVVQPKTAVACNDATSLRIEAIARALGAEVFRAETGEANVVGLARQLRERGYQVRILGEGSNGGVITHPASVRDPLNTVTAILKLLYLPDSAAGTATVPGPYRLWLERSGQADEYHPEFALCDVLASLPRFATTSVFEDRAALHVRTRDHGALKNAYEPLFRASWPALAAALAPALGPLTWKARYSAGTAEMDLHGRFGDSGSGGLKIVLVDSSGAEAGFLWMRGSGTEPVFRIMADVRGSDMGLEALLLERHAALVREADALVT